MAKKLNINNFRIMLLVIITGFIVYKNISTIRNIDILGRPAPNHFDSRLRNIIIRRQCSTKEEILSRREGLAFCYFVKRNIPSDSIVLFPKIREPEKPPIPVVGYSHFKAILYPIRIQYSEYNSKAVPDMKSKKLKRIEIKVGDFSFILHVDRHSRLYRFYAQEDQWILCPESGDNI